MRVCCMPSLLSIQSCTFDASPSPLWNRLGLNGTEAPLTCAGDCLLRESSSASAQNMLGALQGGTAHPH